MDEDREHDDLTRHGDELCWQQSIDRSTSNDLCTCEYDTQYFAGVGV